MSMIALAASALALAAPIIAEDTKPVADRPAATDRYQPTDATRVCVKQTLTGSRVPRMYCDTMKGWKAKGVDPFER